MSFLISDAWADAPAAAADPGFMGLLFPIGLVIILYLFMIRPQVKRQKEHRKLVDNLGKGDEVQTMGGLVGKIKDLDENFCSMEISEGVVVKIRRASVEVVLPKGSL